MPRSTYRLTVPQEFYDMVCSAAGQPFADSYLFGATLDGRILTPRTAIGYDRMHDRTDFMGLLKQLDIKLVRPTPWPGAPGENRASSEDTW